jgi:hypothetical protein
MKGTHSLILESRSSIIDEAMMIVSNLESANPNCGSSECKEERKKERQRSENLKMMCS